MRLATLIQRLRRERGQLFVQSWGNEDPTMNAIALKPLTANERQWIETLCVMTDDRVPELSLRARVRLGRSVPVPACDIVSA